MKTGWTNGRDRHRAKAGNRPAPVVLDLPWWHREQPEEQPEEQAAEQDMGTAQEQGAEQARVQPGNSPEEQPASTLPPGLLCQRCKNGPVAITLDGQRVCGACVADSGDPRGEVGNGPEVQPPHPSGLSPEQPEVQPEEQAAGTAQEQGRGQVQGGPQEQAAIEIGKSYSRCSRCLGNVTDYATAEACDGCGARFVELRPDYAEHVEQIKSERSDLPVVGPQSRSPHPSGLSPEQPAAMTVVGEKQSHCSRCLSPVSPDWTECRTCQAALTGFMTTSGAYLPRDPENRGSSADGWPMVAEVREIPDCDVHSQVLGTPGVPAAYDAEMKSGAWAFMCPDCFEQHGTGELGLGKGQRLALKAPTTDPAEPLNSAPAPADGTTDGAPAPTDTTTEGDPVPHTGIDELDNLTSVKDFAKLVGDLADESDFAQLVEFCKNASDETRDFGADMSGDVSDLEEIAAKIGDLLSELVDAAQQVNERSDELIGG